MTHSKLAVSLRVLAGALSTLALAPGYAFADDSAEPQRFQVSTTTGPPGAVIDIKGSCGATATASLEYLGGAAYDVEVELVTDAAGQASGHLRVPPQAPGGTYEFDIRCQSHDIPMGSSRYTFVVTDAPLAQGRHVIDLKVDDLTDFHAGSMLGASGVCKLFGTEPAGAVIELWYTGNESFNMLERVMVEPSLDGRFTGVVTMPEYSSPQGYYMLTARCYLDGAEFGWASKSTDPTAPTPPTTSPTLSVEASPTPVPPSSPTTLPNTGTSGPRVLGPIGLAMVASGLGLVVASRRRPHR